MMKFRKRPVMIEAVQVARGEAREIPTLEGTMLAGDGDWIITGVKGEIYPCKDDIFKLTYEQVIEGERTMTTTPEQQAEAVALLKECRGYLKYGFFRNQSARTAPCSFCGRGHDDHASHCLDTRTREFLARIEEGKR